MKNLEKLASARKSWLETASVTVEFIEWDSVSHSIIDEDGNVLVEVRWAEEKEHV